MKSLLMFAPNPTDATSFYRAVGPIQELKKKMGFQLLIGSDVNWATLKGCDAVMMQRPFTPGHVRILEMAKANGKKVWVDYDDDLFAVPRSNRTFRLYGNQQNQNNIAQILAKADLVTVSTPALKKKFTEILERVSSVAQEVEGLSLNPGKIHVVPNAYDEGFVSSYAKTVAKPHQNKLIAWRGSDTHDKDLLSVTPEMKSAFSKHLDWTFNFIGSPFWKTIEELETIPGIKETNVIETESLDPSEYWKMLWMVSPALMLVPLWDCEFNRSKSNIAWIEACHAGAATLAPDWEEWRRPGVINYSSPEDFEDKLDRFMRGEFDGKKIADEGRAFIKENLTLEKVNRLRELLLRELWE